jgi:Calcineurin-like phosphoesterase
MRKPIAVLLLLSPALLLLVAPGEAGAAELLSGPYVIAPRTDGGTVCWQTVGAAPGGVRYRARGSRGWRVARGGNTRFQAVTLKGLKPGTSYQVEVLSGAEKLGGLSFRTAPAKAESFTFYVYGDTRSNPGAHSMIATALAAEARRRKQLTFVVLTGDLARYGSGAEETAEQFFTPAAPVLQIMPVIPLRGNHECGTELFKKYFPRPARPEAIGNPDDYFVDWGSARVIILDQYGPARSSVPRMKWLAARLAEAGAGKQWRFLGFHEPMYSSGSHGENTRWRDLALPTMREGRVHAVFCGHDHNYERIKPQYGITHFVTGGGGAPLRDIGSKPLNYSAKFRAVHHFMTVEVTPTKLLIEAHALSPESGKFEVFDRVEIPADCQWATASAESTSPHSSRESKEVLWDYRPNPWKMRVLIAGLILLGLALGLKAIQIARRKPGDKKKP